jgi:hypothetical protein
MWLCYLEQELKAENERVLANMKMQLEKEFQSKLRMILDGLDSSADRNADADEDETGKDPGDSAAHPTHSRAVSVSTSTGRKQNAKKKTKKAKKRVDDYDEDTDDGAMDVTNRALSTAKSSTATNKQAGMLSAKQLLQQQQQQQQLEARFGPYMGASSKDRLAARASTKSGNNNDDALLLATTGQASSKQAPLSVGVDQTRTQSVNTPGSASSPLSEVSSDLKLLPTERARLQDKIANHQQSAQLDQQQTQHAQQSQGTDREDEASKYMLSCTRSMLRKTEHLLSESRDLAGVKNRKGSNRNNNHSKSLPSIGNATSGGSNAGSRNNTARKDEDNADKFPPIRSSSAENGAVSEANRFAVTPVRGRKKKVSIEEDAAAAAKQNEDVDEDAIDLNEINKHLPPGWINQRVNDFEDATDPQQNQTQSAEESHSRAEWENQIARHILSVYATTKATSTSSARGQRRKTPSASSSSSASASAHAQVNHESRAILDYVDKRGRERDLQSVLHYAVDNDDDVIGGQVSKAKALNRAQELAEAEALAQAQAQKSPRHATTQARTLPGGNSNINSSNVNVNVNLDGGLSRSMQLRSRENLGALDVEEQQALTFEQFNADSSGAEGNADNNVESSWAGRSCIKQPCCACIVT